MVAPLPTAPAAARGSARAKITMAAVRKSIAKNRNRPKIAPIRPTTIISPELAGLTALERTSEVNGADRSAAPLSPRIMFVSSSARFHNPSNTVHPAV